MKQKTFKEITLFDEMYAVGMCANDVPLLLTLTPIGIIRTLKGDYEFSFSGDNITHFTFSVDPNKMEECGSAGRYNTAPKTGVFKWVFFSDKYEAMVWYGDQLNEGLQKIQRRFEETEDFIVKAQGAK